MLVEVLTRFSSLHPILCCDQMTSIYRYIETCFVQWIAGADPRTESIHENGRARNVIRVLFPQFMLVVPTFPYWGRRPLETRVWRSWR